VTVGDPISFVCAAVVLVSISTSVLLALRNRNKELELQNRVIWWLSLFVVLGAGVTLVLLMTHGIDRLAGQLLFFRFIAPGVFFICLLWMLVASIRKRTRQCISVLLALVGFAAVSGALQRNEQPLRPSLRWFLWSRQYKAEVLAQPDPANQEFKHLIWDTWGGGFVETGFNITYLVLDPNDSLADAAKSQVPGRFAGIPCEVPDIVRLEKQWYAVRFYADENWVNCRSRTAGPRQN
jgi:hypothetical protein